LCVDKYRGQLSKDNGRVAAVLTIVTAIVQLQTKARPLRVHEPMLGEEDEEAVEEKAAELRAAGAIREMVDGLPIGKAADIRILPDGSVRGPGDDGDDEPDSRAIDTYRRASDFVAGISTACVIALIL